MNKKKKKSRENNSLNDQSSGKVVQRFLPTTGHIPIPNSSKSIASIGSTGAYNIKEQDNEQKQPDSGYGSSNYVASWLGLPEETLQRLSKPKTDYPTFSVESESGNEEEPWREDPTTRNSFQLDESNMSPQSVAAFNSISAQNNDTTLSSLQFGDFHQHTDLDSMYPIDHLLAGAIDKTDAYGTEKSQEHVISLDFRPRDSELFQRTEGFSSDDGLAKERLELLVSEGCSQNMNRTLSPPSTTLAKVLLEAATKLVTIDDQDEVEAVWKVIRNDDLDIEPENWDKVMTHLAKGEWDEASKLAGVNLNHEHWQYLLSRSREMSHLC